MIIACYFLKQRRDSTSLHLLVLLHLLVAVHIIDAWPAHLLRGSRIGYGRNIRPLHCVAKSGDAGICMFAWNCMKSNGTHLGTCIDRFYFGSCCQLKMGEHPPDEHSNEIDDDSKAPLKPGEPVIIGTIGEPGGVVEPELELSVVIAPDAIVEPDILIESNISIEENTISEPDVVVHPDKVVQSNTISDPGTMVKPFIVGETNPLVDSGNEDAAVIDPDVVDDLIEPDTIVQPEIEMEPEIAMESETVVVSDSSIEAAVTTMDGDKGDDLDVVIITDGVLNPVIIVDTDTIGPPGATVDTDIMVNPDTSLDMDTMLESDAIVDPDAIDGHDIIVVPEPILNPDIVTDADLVETITVVNLDSVIDTDNMDTVIDTAIDPDVVLPVDGTVSEVIIDAPIDSEGTSVGTDAILDLGSVIGEGVAIEDATIVDSIIPTESQPENMMEEALIETTGVLGTTVDILPPVIVVDPDNSNVISSNIVDDTQIVSGSEPEVVSHLHDLTTESASSFPTLEETVLLQESDVSGIGTGNDGVATELGSTGMNDQLESAISIGDSFGGFGDPTAGTEASENVNTLIPETSSIDIEMTSLEPEEHIDNSDFDITSTIEDGGYINEEISTTVSIIDTVVNMSLAPGTNPLASVTSSQIVEESDSGASIGSDTSGPDGTLVEVSSFVIDTDEMQSSDEVNSPEVTSQMSPIEASLALDGSEDSSNSALSGEPSLSGTMDPMTNAEVTPHSGEQHTIDPFIIIPGIVIEPHPASAADTDLAQQEVNEETNEIIPGDGIKLTEDEPKPAEHEIIILDLSPPSSSPSPLSSIDSNNMVPTNKPTSIAPVTEPSMVTLVFPDESDNAIVPPVYPSSSLGTTTATTVSPEEQSQLLVDQLKTSNYKDVCGQPVVPNSRIVGGSEASYGEWPWQVSLRQWRSVAFLHKCGAALVNENWAITAAHCVEGIEPDQLLLVMGEFDLGTVTEPHIHVERSVQVIAMHDKFEPRTFEYDLALLRFMEPIEFQPNIIPICIPDDDYDFLDTTGYVTGWGRLYEDGPLPTVMQKVPVPVIPNESCEVMYKNAGYIEHIPNIFICAGYQIGKLDSCEGDSGGPLVINYKNRWRLAGIISWGIGCAVPNQPGVYTRISEFREWINKIIVF